MRPLIEICVDSVGSAAAAQAGGADRVELCDNLIEGGTTPSAGSIAFSCEKLSIPVNVIIRPRGSDFCYSDIEFEVMKRDISMAKELGANGVVIGILLPDGCVDEARTRELIRLARPMSVTFHRAFDMTRDPFEALESLVALGVDRVLTSGQEATAAKGIELIGQLVERAGDRISIMACGEIREENARQIVVETGVREIHFTGFVEKESAMQYRNERVYMGNELCPEYVNRVTDAEKITGVMRAIGE